MFVPSHNTATRGGLGAHGWVLAASAGAAAWIALVAASPRGFFALAVPFCLAWGSLSVMAAPDAARRLAPRASDLALGLLTGAALYAGSRAFLLATCGPLTRAFCGPLAGMFARFETRTLPAALALGLVLAPAEELYWRGVLQGRLAARLGSAWAVVIATLVAAAATLASGEPLLALAMVPTYGAWGALAAWRRSLVPGMVSHAVWSVLIAVLLPPI